MQRKAESAPGTPGGRSSSDPLYSAYTRLAEAERNRKAGNLDHAQALCEALLREHPDYVGALQTLGVTHLAKKNYRQALACLHQAAMHCPNDWINLTNLATAYLKSGAVEFAAQTLEQARRLGPDEPGINMALADIHREQRQYELAAEAYQRVLDKIPAHADAAHGLGDCLGNLGHHAGAAAALTRAHKLNPGSAAILYSVSQLPASATDLDLLGALDRLRPQAGQDQEDFETWVAFTRASALDRRGRYQEAWTSLSDANGRERPKHMPLYRKHVVRMEAARRAALAQPVRGDASGVDVSSGRPLSLCIVGPSRSGKTTLESLVARLNGVKRGHESRFIERAARRTSQLAGLLTTSNPAELPTSLDDRLGETYQQEVGEFAQGAGIVTDTHPSIMPYVGRAATAIRSLRFIFVKRDRFDVALRIYMKRYRAGNYHASDVGSIFEYLSWYDDMAGLWQAKLPGLTLSVDYEAMIADPKATLARVADFCGVSAPDGPLPELGDDRACSRPYREFLAKALAMNGSLDLAVAPG